MKKVLFICKSNESYGRSTTGKRSGLYNSTRFVADALSRNDVRAEVVEVDDNNAIDRHVAAFRPDKVIIEALWVVPEKFDVLKKLHPNVKWCVHLHSNAPFLALEGMAVQWVLGYAQRGVHVIVNSLPALNALRAIVPDSSLTILKNTYPVVPHCKKLAPNRELHVGCFGAVRPMKNQFTQALAAITFAKQAGFRLHFYINAGRSETGGDPVLRNLRALFADRENGKLIECPWLDHDDFLYLLHNTIDLSLQVSLSETFNIVTADSVSSGVPVLTSTEVEWVSKHCHAATDDVSAIVRGMFRVFDDAALVATNQKLLATFSEMAASRWVEFAKRS